MSLTIEQKQSIIRKDPRYASLWPDVAATMNVQAVPTDSQASITRSIETPKVSQMVSKQNLQRYTQPPPPPPIGGARRKPTTEQVQQIEQIQQVSTTSTSSQSGIHPHVQNVIRNFERTEKPRVNIAELAAKRRRCGEAKAAGRPCTEFSQSSHTVPNLVSVPSPIPIPVPVPTPSAIPPIPETSDTEDMSKYIRWACGITTVSVRRKVLFPRTLASIKAAGFPDPVIFLDGADHRLAIDYEAEFHLPVVNRYPKILTFGNWILGLAELYIRNPLAHFYAMFQDDLVLSKNVRAYLERCPYPDGSSKSGVEGKKGYWNLYTFDINRRRIPRDSTARKELSKGWFPSTQQGLGAVALVFDRETVWDLITERENIITRPAHPTERRWRNIDGGIHDGLKRKGRLEYIHSPSLCQHIGLQSTMGSGRHPDAKTFMGEDFDCLTLLGEKERVGASG